MIKTTSTRLLVTLIALAACVFGVRAQVSADIRAKTFEKAWQVVNERFWDPTFGGVDWKGAHDRYAPQVAAAKTDAEFYGLLNKMMGELKTSHLDILTPDVVARMQEPPVVVGLGYREIDGRLVITRLLEGTSAAESVLRPGFVIEKIDGKAIANFDDAQKGLAGAANSKLTLTYLDGQDAEHDVALERRLVGDTNKSKVAGMSLYALIESKRLDGNIGYLRFSNFFSSLDTQIKAAVESLHDTSGMIIDLRGNSGGEDSVGLHLAGMFLEKETQLAITRRRTGDDLGYKAKPAKNPYRGPVAILVDELSRSQSEAVSAGLQDVGRAVIIGRTTAAGDMDADAVKLPDGSIMFIAQGQPRTPKGYIAEGHGVKPDIDVPLTRAGLLAGHDSQLEEAIQYIKTRKP